jgi:hypothetical protein
LPGSVIDLKNPPAVRGLNGVRMISAGDAHLSTFLLVYQQYGSGADIKYLNS